MSNDPPTKHPYVGFLDALMGSDRAESFVNEFLRMPANELPDHLRREFDDFARLVIIWASVELAQCGATAVVRWLIDNDILVEDARATVADVLIDPESGATATVTWETPGRPGELLN